MNAALRSFFLTLVGEDEEFLSVTDLDSAVVRSRAALRALPAPYRLAIRCCFFVLEYLAPLAALRFRPLSRLPLAERTALHLAWQGSRSPLRRYAYFAARNFAAFHLFSDEAYLRRIGYEGRKGC